MRLPGGVEARTVVRMQRVVKVGAVLVGVVGILVIGLLVLRGGSDDDGQDKDDPKYATPIPDDPGVRGALDQLIAAGRATDYHVVFDLVPTEGGAAPDTTLTLEQWSSAGRFREDRTTSGPNGTSRTSNSGTGSTARSCQTVDGKQTCTEARSAPPDLPTLFLQALAGREVPRGLTVADVEVLGRPARCFEAERLGELCLGTDGIPLRLTVEAQTIEATTVDANVSDASFDVG